MVRGYAKLQQRLRTNKTVATIGESRKNFSKTLTTLENRRARVSKKITAFNTAVNLGDEFFFRKKKREFSKNIKTIRMESKQVKKLKKIREQIREKIKKLKKRR